MNQIEGFETKNTRSWDQDTVVSGPAYRAEESQERMNIDTIEGFETRNARAWDTDTVASEPTWERPQTADTPPIRNAADPRPATIGGFESQVSRVSSPSNVAGSREPPRMPSTLGRQPGKQPLNDQGVRHPPQPGRGYYSTSSGSTEIFTARRQSYGNVAIAARTATYQTRSTCNTYSTGYQPSGQRYNRPPLAKSRWAEPNALVTTRRAKDRVVQKTKAAEKDSFLKPPTNDEHHPVIGYYMWPSKHEQPGELLGWRLERLDPIRLQYQVYIEELPQELPDSQGLKVSCPAFHQQPERTVAEAIVGIRAAVQDAKSKVIAAEPIYIVVPPAPDAMRSIVRAKTIVVTQVPRLFPVPSLPPTKKVWRASGLELSGQLLSEEDKLSWETSGQPEMIQSNLRRFEDHLVENLTNIARDKGLMRMRVHFGRVTLARFLKPFKEDKQSFQEFASMMSRSQMVTKFDKEIRDATIALRMLDKIMSLPDCFRPAQSSLVYLEEVEFNYTAVLFVKTPEGQQYRIEADVDRILEPLVGYCPYQLGTNRLFYDNKTNKRIQVEILDVEKQIDYTLEVTSDNAIHEIPKLLLSVIQGSVTAQSLVRQDALGFYYPNVGPKFTPGLEVTGVTVRSAAQYILKDSSYLVEIAIYRQWAGMDTSSEPNIVAGVSMYHHQWDYQMRSFEDSPSPRIWSRDLSDFFGDTEGGSNRLAKFLSEVEIVQELLSEATKEAEAMQADQEAVNEKDSEKFKNIGDPIEAQQTAVEEEELVNFHENDTVEIQRPTVGDEELDLYSADA